MLEVSKGSWDTVEHMVMNMLEKYPYTRNSDHVLECMIVQEMGYGSYSFTEIMMHRKELKIPNFATIERCRRKIQSKYPHLKANEEVTQARMDMQTNYIDYAKGRV